MPLRCGLSAGTESMLPMTQPRSATGTAVACGGGLIAGSHSANAPSSYRTSLLSCPIRVCSVDQSRGLYREGRHRKQCFSNYLSPWGGEGEERTEEETGNHGSWCGGAWEQWGMWARCRTTVNGFPDLATPPPTCEHQNLTNSAVNLMQSARRAGFRRGSKAVASN